MDKATKRQHLCLVVDHLSGSIEFEAFRTQEAIPFVTWLRGLFEQYRSSEGEPVPRLLHADNGGAFVSQQLKDLCEEFGVKLVHGLPYHPQSQGKVERQNGVIKNKITALLTELHLAADSWYGLLPALVARMNATISTVTKIPPVDLRPTPGDLRSAATSKTVTASLGLPAPQKAAAAPSREDLEQYAVRQTVRASLRFEDADTGATPFLVGQRVYVKNGRAQYLPFGYVAFGAAARIARVRKFKYRLLWISEGYDNERSGTLSGRYYDHRELKPVHNATPNAELRSVSRRVDVAGTRDPYEVVAVLGVYGNKALVRHRSLAAPAWVHKSEIPQEVLQRAAPVEATTYEQAIQLQENFTEYSATPIKTATHDNRGQGQEDSQAVIFVGLVL